MPLASPSASTCGRCGDVGTITGHMGELLRASRSVGETAFLPGAVGLARVVSGSNGESLAQAPDRGQARGV